MPSVVTSVDLRRSSEHAHAIFVTVVVPSSHFQVLIPFPAAGDFQPRISRAVMLIICRV